MSRVGIVKRRQRDRVDVHCPVCKSRHWLPDQPTGRCSRKPGPNFTIRQPERNHHR